MIRTKGSGNGNVVEAVRHMKNMNREIVSWPDAWWKKSLDFQNKRHSIRTALKVKELGRLPVVILRCGIATPADAALMMQLGCDGVFVGSGISKQPIRPPRARAIVRQTAYFNDPQKVLEASMVLERQCRLRISQIPPEQILAGRGW